MKPQTDLRASLHVAPPQLGTADELFEVYLLTDGRQQDELLHRLASRRHDLSDSQLERIDADMDKWRNARREARDEQEALERASRWSIFAETILEENNPHLASVWLRKLTREIVDARPAVIPVAMALSKLCGEKHWVLERERELEDARRDAKHVLDWVQACQLGRIAREQGKSDRAIILAERAVELAPEQSHAWAALAAALRAYGQLGEAIQAARSGLELVSSVDTSRPVRTALIAALREDGQLGAAKAEADLLTSTDAYLHDAFALMALSKLASAMHDPDLAARYFEQAEAIEPIRDRLPALQMLADAYAAKNRPADVERVRAMIAASLDRRPVSLNASKQHWVCVSCCNGTAHGRVSFGPRTSRTPCLRQ